MKNLARHGFLTQMTFFELNFVNLRIQDFMSKRLMMAPKGEPTFTGDAIKTLTQKYHKNIQINFAKEYDMSVSYKLFPLQDKLIIESCEITGYYQYVIDFFVDYWTTTLNFEAAKGGEIVVNYLLQDRASLTLNFPKETATIKIINTTIPDSKAFTKQFNENFEIQKLKEQENNKKKEEERISFLNERKVKIYDFNETDLKNYKSRIVETVSKEIYYQKDKFDSWNKVKIETDTTGNQKLIIQLTTGDKLPTSIEAKIREIKIPTQKLNGYFISSIGEFEINVANVDTNVKLKKTSKGTTFKTEPTDRVKNEVEKYLTDKPNGTYELRVKIRGINDKTDINVRRESYQELLFGL